MHENEWRLKHEQWTILTTGTLVRSRANRLIFVDFVDFAGRGEMMDDSFVQGSWIFLVCWDFGVQ